MTPINKTLLIIFALQAAVILPLYLAYVRKVAISKHLKRLLLLAFLASPVYVAIKGITSAIYFSDLAGPFLVLIALVRLPQLSPASRRVTFWLTGLLLIAPLLGTLLNYGLQSDGSSQFTGRGLQSLVVWLYRNTLYLAIFVLAASVRVDMEGLVRFLKAMLVLNLGFILIGAIDYSGLHEFSAYELIVASVRPEHFFSYSGTTIGWGFLGMFRGAVGQWFAMTCILGLPFILMFRGRWRWIALANSTGSAILVLCSLSRAGMVGIAVGLLVCMLGFGSRMVKIAVPLLVLSLAVVPFLYNSTVSDRIESIGTYADDKQRNRIDGWAASLHHFADNPLTLLLGNGATNRDDVYKIIGAYGAHNEYIDVIFRAGLIGFGFMTAIILSLLRTILTKLRQCGPSQGRAMLVAALAVVLANCVMGFTQDHFYREYSGYSAGTFMYLLYGVFVGVIPVLAARTKAAATTGARP